MLAFMAYLYPSTYSTSYIRVSKMGLSDTIPISLPSLSFIFLLLSQNQDHHLFFPLQCPCWRSCRMIQGQIYRQLQGCCCLWWRMWILLERLHSPLRFPPTWRCQFFCHAFLVIRYQCTVHWIGLQWACCMHQTVSYFDLSVPLYLWLAALWFWIPGLLFQVESNNSWEIQHDGRLPGINLVLFLQVLRHPWTRLGSRTQSLGIGRCQVSLLWLLQEAYVLLIWRQRMLSIALFLTRTVSHSTREILVNVSQILFNTIVFWVHGCIHRQDSNWIVAFRMNVHRYHNSSQTSGVRSYLQLVCSRNRRQAYPLLRTSGQTSPRSHDILISSW